MCVFAGEVCRKKWKGLRDTYLKKKEGRREKERVSGGKFKKGAVLRGPVFPRPLHNAQGNQWQHGSRGGGRLDCRDPYEESLVDEAAVGPSELWSREAGPSSRPLVCDGWSSEDIHVAKYM